MYENFYGFMNSFKNLKLKIIEVSNAGLTKSSYTK